MFICLALLVNNEIQNRIRKLVFEIDNKYKTGIVASLLPQHISLKETFEYNNIGKIETFIKRELKDFGPVQINFGKLELVKISNNSGLIWWKVLENSDLRSMHSKINVDLERQLGIKNSNYDGAGFHFHATIMFGGKEFDEYQLIYDNYKNYLSDQSYLANELAIFCSNEGKIIPGTFYSYHIETIK